MVNNFQFFETCKLGEKGREERDGCRNRSFNKCKHFKSPKSENVKSELLDYCPERLMESWKCLHYPKLLVITAMRTKFAIESVELKISTASDSEIIGKVESKIEVSWCEQPNRNQSRHFVGIDHSSPLFIYLVLAKKIFFFV